MIRSGFGNPIQSDSIFQSDPIRSWFCQSDPIRPDLDFENTIRVMIRMIRPSRNLSENGEGNSQISGSKHSLFELILWANSYTIVFSWANHGRRNCPGLCTVISSEIGCQVDRTLSFARSSVGTITDVKRN